MKGKEKPGWRTGQRTKEPGKDSNFQPIGRNCSLNKLAKKYHQGFDEFCQDYPKGTPISFLREAWDLVFESMHLVNDGGGKRWKV